MKANHIALDEVRVGVPGLDHKAVAELNNYGIKTAMHRAVVVRWNRSDTGHRKIDRWLAKVNIVV